MAKALMVRQSMKETEFGGNPDVVRAALYRMARLGQCIQDLSAGVVRWRQVMPPEVAVDKVVPENPETSASRILRANVSRDEEVGRGMRLLEGKVGDTPVEALLDGDGIFKRAKCNCSHHFKGGLRMGPCRHLLALRSVAWKP